MVRVFAFLAALGIASPVLWLALYETERLSFIAIQPYVHSGRFSPAGVPFAVFISIYGGAVAIAVGVFVMKERRAKRDEDVSLTPMVRRLPSGLREL